MISAMADFGTAGLNAALSGLGSAAATASLHTADPGTTGGSECAGGSYARVAVTFGTPSGGSVTAGAVTLNVPASTTIGWFGLWNSGGGYLGGGPLSASESYGASGTYQLTPVLTATG
jgi:hypothetical protein